MSNHRDSAQLNLDLADGYALDLEAVINDEGITNASHGRIAQLNRDIGRALKLAHIEATLAVADALDHLAGPGDLDPRRAGQVHHCSAGCSHNSHVPMPYPAVGGGHR